MPSTPLTIVPDPDDPGCATAYVRAEVGGRDHHFVLDTGAASSRLPLDDDTARLRVVRTSDDHGVFGGSSGDVVLLPELRVAGLPHRDLEVGRAASPALLGLDVLGGHVLRVDLRAATLELRETGSMSTDHPLRRGPHGHLGVEAAWEGVTAAACIDTGAGITLVDEGFYARHPELFETVGSSIGTDSAGHQQETSISRIAPYRIANARFASHVVAVVPLPQQAGFAMDLLLGYPTLAQAVWTLDLPASRFRIEA